jgi:hypothetical protein
MAKKKRVRWDTSEDGNAEAFLTRDEVYARHRSAVNCTNSALRTAEVRCANRFCDHKSRRRKRMRDAGECCLCRELREMCDGCRDFVRSELCPCAGCNNATCERGDKFIFTECDDERAHARAVLKRPHIRYCCACEKSTPLCNGCSLSAAGTAS